MSVTAPLGFRAAGVVAGLKTSGDRDVAVVINDGPVPRRRRRLHRQPGAGRPGQVVPPGGQRRPGPRGRAQLRRRQRLHRAARLPGHPRHRRAAGRRAGRLGGRDRGLLDRPDRRAAADGQAAARRGRGRRRGRPVRRRARRRRDPHHRHDRQDRLPAARPTGYTIGGMAKGAGMLAPALATMLVVLTTDADLSAAELDSALRSATAVTFDRLDSDGCMSTNDTVLLMASGASGVKPDQQGLHPRADRGLRRPGPPASAQRRGRLQVRHDRGGRRRQRGRRGDRRPRGGQEQPAQVRARRRGPELGPGAVRGRHHRRRLRPRPAQRRDERHLGLPGGRARATTGPRSTCAARDVTITVDLSAGPHSAVILTTDLTEAYVHENSAYST